MRWNHLTMNLFAVSFKNPNAGEALVTERADTALDFRCFIRS
jgi:hypothetical protein